MQKIVGRGTMPSQVISHLNRQAVDHGVSILKDDAMNQEFGSVNHKVQ